MGYRWEAKHVRTLEVVMVFLAVLGVGGRGRVGGLCPLRGQQWGFEGAGSGAVTGGEHLAGEMMKGVVSFWGGTKAHQ